MVGLEQGLYAEDFPRLETEGGSDAARGQRGPSLILRGGAPLCGLVPPLNESLAFSKFNILLEELAEAENVAENSNLGSNH